MATLREIELAKRVYGEYAHLSYTEAIHRISRETGMNINTIKGMVNRACKHPDVMILREKRTDAKQPYQNRKQQHQETISAVIPDGFKIRGVSKLLDENQQVVSQWVKYDKDTQRQTDVIEALLKQVKASVTPRTHTIPVANHHHDDSLMMFYPMVDLHMGLRASWSETGEDWDLDKAYRTYLQAYSDIISRSPHTERAVIANLGDFTHVDSDGAKTPRGTPVDVDGRFSDIVDKSIALAIDVIDMTLQKHQDVEVYWIAGNHDESTALVINAALKQLYRNQARVSFPQGRSRFHVFSHGTVAIGITHGDTVKMNQLPLLMANDYPTVWARSQYRVWFTGHIHHKRVEDFVGCTVESLRSPTSKDAWHHNKGYRAYRVIESICFSKVGEYARLSVNV